MSGHKQYKRIAGADIIMYAIIMAVAIAGGLLSLGMGIDFDVYTKSRGADTFGNYAFIKSIQESGIKGMYVNYRVGAPGVSHIIDFPGADLFMGSIIRFISLFTSSTPRIMYIYYLLTFVMDAEAFALLLRKLQVRRVITASMSLIYSFAPFHFMRGILHITLLNYMPFAMALYLSLCITGYLEDEKRWKIIVCAVLLGFSYGYYYAFGLILMAVAFLFRLHKEYDFRKAISFLSIPATTLCAVIIALSPQIIFNNIYGRNELAGVRYPFEQELYGLKLVQMFLSPEYSRFYTLIPRLSNAYKAYTETAPLVNENASASLGVVTLAAFVCLCIAFLYSFAAKGKTCTKDWELIDYLALSVITLILAAIMGGFGEVFNYLVNPQIRCYNRCSIFIAGISLVFLAFILNKLSSRKAALATVLSILLFAVSIYDTVPVTNAEWQDEMKETQKDYETFFGEAEDTLDKGAMVYQLPYLDYPEESAEFDYKHFIGFLFSDELRWSYGGVKGRDMEAAALFKDEGMSLAFLKGIKDAGFEAVYIDRNGYEDNGERVLDFYDGLGVMPIISGDGNLYIYDIRKIEL